ncbi:hypothetical protein LLG95_09795 [bacterium]|nr:hypothetical protein [bacterium]
MSIRFLAAFAVVAMLAGGVLAAEPVTCAIVPDPSVAQSPLADLMLVELTRNADLALVERAEVDKILGEQKLQLAMGAGDIDSRRRLGHLLKARLIVQLRSGARDIGGRRQPVVECVISESDHGLRLVRDIHPWDPARAEQEARALANEVGQAAGKLKQRIRWIFAVPPFESQDLVHRYDHMQRSFAEVLASRLAAQPCAQVVEIDEARALANEARLTNADKTVRPLLSFFINGKYRNDGEGAALRTTIEMELMQSGRKLDACKGDGLDAKSAQEFLQSTLNQFFAKATQAQAAPFDARRECAELEKRAANFEQIGEWENAFALLEAAMLLQPDRPEIDRKLAAIGAGAVRTLSKQTKIVVNPNRDMMMAMQLQQLGRMKNQSTAELKKAADKIVNSQTSTEYKDYQNQGGLGNALIGAYGLYMRGLDHFAAYLRTINLSAISVPQYGTRRYGFGQPYGQASNNEALFEWKFNIFAADFFVPYMSEAGEYKINARRELLRILLAWVEGLNDKDFRNALNFIRYQPAIADDPMYYGSRFDPFREYQLNNRRPEPEDRDIQLRIVKLFLREGDIKNAINIACCYHYGRDYADFLNRVAGLGPEGNCVAEYGRITAKSDKDQIEPLAQLANNIEKDAGMAPVKKDILKETVASQLAYARDQVAKDEARRREREKNPPRMVRIGPNMWISQEEAPKASAPPAAVADPDIEFVPLAICKDPLINGVGRPSGYVGNTRAPEPPRTDTILGWIDCNGIDVLWSHDRLMAIRQMDKVELLMKIQNLDRGRVDVVFDGKRLWVNDRNGLCAIDPADGRVEKIKFESDLPPGMLWIAGTGLNKLFMIGYSDRTWVANFECLTGGKYKLDIFHEARLQSGNPTDTGLAFKPGFIRKTDESKPGEISFIVSRNLPGRAGQFPLIVCPARRTVAIGRETISNPFEANAPVMTIGEYTIGVDAEGGNLRDNKGHAVKLKGRIPAWVQANRVVTTHHYGSVLLTSSDFDRATAWQIILRRQPKDLIAKAPEPTPMPAPAQSIRPMADAVDELKGHTFIVRVYAAQGEAGRPFNKIEVPVRATGIEIERNQAEDGSFLFILAEDQTDPVIKKWVGSQWGIWTMTPPAGGASDAAMALKLSGRPASMSQCQILDAYGRPIAGAEVIANCVVIVDPRTPDANPKICVAIGRTDAGGMIPTRMGGGPIGGFGRTLRVMQYELDDAKLGHWAIRAFIEKILMPVDPAGASGGVSGRGVDDSGKPVAGAEIRLEQVRLPDGTVQRYQFQSTTAKRPVKIGGAYACWCVTGSDGAFKMMFPTSDGMPPVIGSQYKIAVQANGKPVREAVVKNDAVQAVPFGTHRDCRIVARDAHGGPVAYGQLRGCWLRQEFDGFDPEPAPKPGSFLTQNETPVRIWPGRYRLMPGDYESTNEVEVKADGPAELVFTVRKAATRPVAPVAQASSRTPLTR